MDGREGAGRVQGGILGCAYVLCGPLSLFLSPFLVPPSLPRTLSSLACPPPPLPVTIVPSRSGAAKCHGREWQLLPPRPGHTHARSGLGHARSPVRRLESAGSEGGLCWASR